MRRRAANYAWQSSRVACKDFVRAFRPLKADTRPGACGVAVSGRACGSGVLGTRTRFGARQCVVGGVDLGFQVTNGQRLRIPGLRISMSSVSGKDTLPVKEQILNAAIQHVPSVGWSVDVIELATADLGLSPLARGLFPRGAGDLVSHHERQCRELMMTQLVALDSSQMRVPARIQAAVKTRLLLNVPYLDMWPDAMAIQLEPANALPAFQELATLMDDMWYFAGDTSTDFNWYTKRLMLSGVYITTELHMLTDMSAEFEVCIG